MAKRLMSRRGGSASQPQVTPYQQIELDDGWREWENTKQELVLVKRQLAEKLQAAFAILRSPQDAKTTKTRKQEFVGRLVSECIQRATTSEALAEERRRELDRLKHNSKFLRFQELEIEIDECHTEIERLRTKLETTAISSPTIIAGKLKVSSVPLIAADAGGLLKKTKLEPLNLEKDDLDSRTNFSPSRMYPAPSSTGQVRVVPLAKYEHREGFVSKTRRRALEAEYYKQVRLAQLEVECELEENLHIRAAREAKKLQAIEQQDRQTELMISSARSPQDSFNVALGNSDSTKLLSAEYVKEGEPSSDHEDLTRLDAAPGKPELEQISPQQTHGNEENCADTSAQDIVISSQHNESDAREDESTNRTESVEQGASKEPEPKLTTNTEEINTYVDPEDGGRQEVEANGQIHSKQKMYDDDEFDASGDDTTDNCKATGSVNVEQGVWNVDPNPQNNHQHDEVESNCLELDQPADPTNNGNTNPVVWNVDPNPSDAETDFHSGSGTERVVWNADPHAAGSDASMDDASVVNSDNDDDVHDAALQLEDSVPSEDNHASNVWNLDPNSSVPTEGKLANATSVQEEESAILDEIGERKVWNLDPTSSPDPVQATTNITEAPDSRHLAEMEQPVWNLDPEPVPDVATSPDLLPALSNAEFQTEVVAGTPEERNAGAEASNTVDPNAPDAISDTDSTTDKDNGQRTWNLDPNPTLSSPSPTQANHSESADDNKPTQNADPHVPEGVGAGALSVDAAKLQTESDHETTDNEVDTRNVWNVDPRIPATDPEHDVGSSSAGGGEKDEDTVWNLDPHAGDTREPSNSATEIAAPVIEQEGEVARTPQTAMEKHLDDNSEERSRDDKEPLLDHSESSYPSKSPPNLIEMKNTENEGLEPDELGSSSPGAPTLDEAVGMAEMPEPAEASNPNSPRASEDNSPMDDATPEYTPPSSARDSDAAGDEYDTTW